MQDIHNNEFLDLMRTNCKEIALLSEEDVAALRVKVDRHTQYFNKASSLGYTDLFQQSAKGKLAALNGALLRIKV
jgi:hypothetical protein